MQDGHGCLRVESWRANMERRNDNLSRGHSVYKSKEGESKGVLKEPQVVQVDGV